MLTGGMLREYFADIARRPLLTRTQELAIALEVRDSRRALLSLEASDSTAGPAELRVARRRSARALDRLVSANLRLVLMIARRFRRRGLEFGDVVQEGNAGLVRAAERFEPARGLRFCTYAAYYIAGAIRRAIYDKGRLVRMPVYLQDALASATSVVGCLPDATDDEIAAALRIGPQRVRRIREGGRAAEARLVPLDMVDLTDGETEQPDELLFERRRAERARRLLALLPEREANILRARFEEDATLQQAGARLGLSRERVRQLERLALDKLRAACIDDSAP
jgi:RNA polymerase sigma factor (sigma-70 family)